MANNIGANPWYLDTPSATPVWTGKVYIKELIWNKPAAGATLVILDQNGNTILNTVANTADPMFAFGTLSWVNGFVVTTLSSGTLSVFITK